MQKWTKQYSVRGLRKPREFQKILRTKNFFDEVYLTHLSHHRKYSSCAQSPRTELLGLSGTRQMPSPYISIETFSGWELNCMFQTYFIFHTSSCGGSSRPSLQVSRLGKWSVPPQREGSGSASGFWPWRKTVVGFDHLPEDASSSYILQNFPFLPIPVYQTDQSKTDLALDLWFLKLRCLVQLHL